MSHSGSEASHSWGTGPGALRLLVRSGSVFFRPVIRDSNCCFGTGYARSRNSALDLTTRFEDFSTMNDFPNRAIDRTRTQTFNKHRCAHLRECEISKEHVSCIVVGNMIQITIDVEAILV